MGGLTLQQVQRAMHAFQVKRRVASQLEPWMVSSTSSELMNSQQSNSDSSETKLAIKNVLSTVLKPREMEALSLRYGLTQPDSDVRVSKEKLLSKTKQPCRDYLAEAENDVFGENGIINQSSYRQSELNRQRARTSNNHNIISSNKNEFMRQTSVGRGGKLGEMTFSEIGKQMAISAEYSRRLCVNAMEKLKLAAEDGKLIQLQPLLYSFDMS